jgi:superfamily II DNA helicase RecQ
VRPTSLGALSRVSGVGEAKLAKYGEAFVAAVRAFEGEAHVSAG